MITHSDIVYIKFHIIKLLLIRFVRCLVKTEQNVIKNYLVASHHYFPSDCYLRVVHSTHEFHTERSDFNTYYCTNRI